MSDSLLADTARDAAVERVEAYLKGQEAKDLLRVLTCGSVDDGKSTLLGRLLYDCRLLFEDQLAALESDSGRFGTTGSGNLDFALLVDGLAAEREQGITIDVAYRFFATEKRKFIVADAPGHEQYTRNMVTGASTADVALLLIDARKGMVTQTRRHLTIAGLLGLRHVVVAVNKMDLVDWDQGTFERIAADVRTFAGKISLPEVTCLPLSALTGANVSTPAGEVAPWHHGPCLLEHLETLPVAEQESTGPFRLPVQWVNRPHLDFRGFTGTVTGGPLAAGAEVAVLPGGQTARVSRIVTHDGDLQVALPGQAVTLTLDSEVDVSRGDVIAPVEARPEIADQLAAHVVWLSDTPLLPGRGYLMRLGPAQVGAQVTEIKHALNVNTLDHLAAKHLELNDVALCNLALDRPLPFDPYRDNREGGAFILIDRLTNATVGCGMIDFALRRAGNIHWHTMKVDRAARASAKGQRPCVLWFTGLSGAGKSTVADRVEQMLAARGRHTMTLDGDNVRHGLNRDLGFTDEDRVENIRRVGEVARLMADAGLIVLVSFISPFRSERRLARELMPDGEFLEVFVDAPLEVCEQRDPKGLYKKARAGQIPNFTGIGSAYEPPENPELTLAADQHNPEALAEQVLTLLTTRGFI
ncbi:sulfate adenylyltransferase subunit CysN [Roseospirillum parvum]|uniref:Multifunctional fusion protein n=1 Tax=Roseospirillum parvum TaxID=83401 RepID=A0A1G7W2M8_9PROT|nr:sulfate adenylyltransferase subunit CysN [Roseospirillum parvum]SDG66223.1 bifunctional enzyme CysN/CysC [Roseospirillum parvum]